MALRPYTGHINRRGFIAGTTVAMGGLALAAGTYGTSRVANAAESGAQGRVGRALATRRVTTGLEFPEGPVAMADGSIILSEVKAGRVQRVRPDGSKQLIAKPDGGPAGCAIGPDGALYVCNVGPLVWETVNGNLYPTLSPDVPAESSEGRIERIDLASGKVERIYDRCDGRRLQCPDDLVFDSEGGMWFTDMGRHMQNGIHHGGLYYAKADGSFIRRVVYGMSMNGIGLAPDGRTLFVSVTYERLILAFDIAAPGEVVAAADGPGRVHATFPGRQYVDSLRVTADGGIAQGLVRERQGIARVSPDGSGIEIHDLPGVIPTSLCFGGTDMRDAWICCSGTGELVRTRWQWSGLPLNFRA